MKKILSCLLAIVVLAVTTTSVADAAINFTVTPIKYELNIAPGESVTLPATIKNNGSEAVVLPTATSDFQSTGASGAPSFVRYSELVHPDQQLSSWIDIDQDSLSLEAGEEKYTNFTISVPENATPGGHYGAVFFKNDNSETASQTAVGINVDYGIIILVNVEGEIVVDIEIGETTIGAGGSVNYDRCTGVDTSGSIYDGSCGDVWQVGTDQNGENIYQTMDECFLGDFTPSRYDGKCFGASEEESGTQESGTQESGGEAPEENFEINFQTPIINTGNTHIKPTGKIVLKDEDGSVIKAIGKKLVTNKDGAVVGEDIVDYIPINDQGGNVLPSSQRIFESEWRGFPYKSYDQSGNQIINYWGPSEYYTTKNKQEAGFLMFWERVSETRTHKNITAEIELTYYDENGDPIEFTSAQEFPVQYIEQQVTLNPYVILALLLLGTAGIFIWFGIRWWILIFKKKKCWNCKEKIKSHWDTCPHCSHIQNKKKHKAYEEQKEKDAQSKTPPRKKLIAKNTQAKKTSVKKASSSK